MTGSLYIRSLSRVLAISLVFLAFPLLAQEEYTYSGTNLEDVVRNFAPVIYQQLDEEHPESNFITRFDYDGDFRGDNNWDNVDKFNEEARKAYVYYSASETPNDYYVFYGFYHPRRYSSRCISIIYPCHENDFTGVLLVITKDSILSPEPARPSLDLIQTFVDGDFYTYQFRSDNMAIEGNVQGPYHKLALWSEKGNHDLYIIGGDRTVADHHCGRNPLKVSDEQKEFMKVATETRENHLVYVYGDEAETYTRGRTDGIVNYELIDLKETFFDKIEYALEYHSVFRAPYKYKGNRYKIDDHMVPEKFYGTKYGNNKASFPWGWNDGSCIYVKRGEWFFDPAYSVKTLLGRTIDEELDDYIIHPYFGIDYKGDTVTDDDSGDLIADHLTTPSW